MKTEKELMEEVLENVIKTYSDRSKRAIDEHGGCSFRTKDGRKCAVGMYILVMS